MFDTTNDDATEGKNNAEQNVNTGTPDVNTGANAGDGQDGGEDFDSFEIVLAGSEQNTEDRNKPLSHNEVNAARRLARRREKQLRQQREAFKRGEIPEDLRVAPEDVPQPNWKDYLSGDALEKYDYDEGAAQAAYNADLQKWHLKQLDARSMAMSQQTKRLNEFDRASEQQLKLASDFYSRAEKLAVDDFDEKEEAFRAAGLDGIDAQIMQRWPDKAPAVVYHLGANPEKAERLKNMIQSDPVGATIYITELVSALNLKPKRRSTAPDPDDGITNVGSGAVRTAEDYQRLAEKAAEEGDTQKYLALRKKVKELQNGVK